MKTWQLLKKNPELFPRYYTKEYIIKACRKFFENRNYHELESPIITSALPQERYLDVLEAKISQRNGEDITVYITPTTETYNKKILAAGLGEHFVITKVARGLEEIGSNHSPEFTMLEWYHLDANYFDLMDDCEELFAFILKFLDLANNSSRENLKNVFNLTFDEINNHQIDLKINYKGQQIDLTKGWDRISVPDAVKKHLGVELSEIQEKQKLFEVAKSKGYQVSESDDWLTLFELLFTSEIEDKFSKIKPTFVYNYPKQMCPLTKVNEENPLVSEKVELYLAGKEIANGYSELSDWEAQEQNFLEELAARKELGLKDIKTDTDLVEAIKSGIPKVAGIGMGLDRVAMILANADNIADINYFPASDWL